MISISPAVRADLADLFALQVRPDQQGYAAPNAVSIAEFAYLPDGYIFSTCLDDTIVGLTGLVDIREHDDLEDDDDPEGSFLMRMMVAAPH